MQRPNPLNAVSAHPGNDPWRKAAELCCESPDSLIHFLSMTTRPVQAPISGTIEKWLVEDGEDIHAGEDIVIIKHRQKSVVVTSKTEGSVKTILHLEGETVRSGWKLAIIEDVKAALSSLEDAMANDSKFLKDIKQVVEDVVKPRFDAIETRFDGVNAKLDQLLAANSGGKPGPAPKAPKR